MSSQGSMTRAEREAFLADVHVGVLAIDEPGRGPMSAPVWYLYDDGAVVMNIDGDSVKATLARAAGRASLTVQTEAAPYQYVTVEGPVSLEDGTYDELRMAVRYLGEAFGQWYVEQYEHPERPVVMRLVPERWRTYDFNKALA
jgi:nitroimidazol reductase NimA-like FMN-containing flavoprotein (pyridoxamine 5'-phosphate oxidase superfamily)